MDEKLQQEHYARKHAYTMAESEICGIFNANCELCNNLKGTTNLKGATLSIFVRDDIPIKALFGKPND